MSDPTRRGERLFMGGLVLALVLLQSTGLQRPFLRLHESNGTEFGKHARNHLKFGLGRTLGLMLDVSGPRLEAYENPRDHYYSNHPPLSALLLAGVFSIFGVGEGQFRGFLIAVSIVALLLFRRLAARLLPQPYDRIAAVFFACFPMFVYYSIVTCLQVVALVGVLAAFLSYLRWTESKRPRDYAGIVAGLVLACYSSWEGYYAAPAIVIAHLWGRRPGRAPVFALLGLNVAVFGLYLLHLWTADPEGLAPLRLVLGAGLDRSSLQAPPLGAYFIGEARELILMFTLPVLVLAGIWVFRGPRGTGDGLIAGSACLGLHELVFARLASNHEYYSYFLVVFAALAGAAGLARLSSRRTLSALFVLAFLAQAAWVLPRRLDREGGYVFYHRLGLALEAVTAPEERTFILTDQIPFYTPYYGDRRTTWYDARNRMLLAENTGARRKDVSEEDVLRLLRENPEGLEWAVTTDKATAVPRIEWLQGLDDATLESFGVETRRTPRRDLLDRLCGPPREHGGFLFWKLRGP